MQKRFYFDTSIWLDFFENRDEPNFPKGKLAKELIDKIISDNGKIVYSDLILIELSNSGYSQYDLNYMFSPLKDNLIFIETTKEEIGKGRDISFKRSIPHGDAIHALFARDNNLILITYDEHFKVLLDISSSFKPKDFL